MISSGISGRPTGSVRINRAAPNADALIGAYFAPMASNVLPDLVGNNHLSLGAWFTPVGTPFGTGLGWRGGTRSAIQGGLPPAIVRTGIWGGIVTSAALTCTLGQGTAQWNSGNWDWYLNPYTGTLYGAYQPGGEWNSGVTVPVNRPLVMGLSRDTTAGAAYMDGVQVHAQTYPFTIASTKPINIGVTDLDSTHQTDFVLLFSRALSPADHRAIAANPYQFFRPIGRSLWRPSAVTTYWVQDSLADSSGVNISSHVSPQDGVTWAYDTVYGAVNTLVGSGANRFRPTASGEAAPMAQRNLPSPDYDVEVDINVQSVAGGFAGILARASRTTKDGYTAIYLVGSTGWQLYKLVGGTATQLGSTVTQTLTPGNTYRLRLRCQGTTISAWVDGTSIISVTDSAISVAGSAGIYYSGTATNSTGLHVSNFTAGPIVVSTNTSLAISANVAVTASATFSTTVPNTTLSVSGGVAVTGAAVFSTTVPSASLAINANVVVTAAATFSTTVPGATLSLSGGVFVTGSAVFSTTVPNANLAIAANVDVVGAIVLSASAPSGSLAISANVDVTGSAVFSTTVPNANLAISGGVSVTGAATFSTTVPNANLAINATIPITGAIVLATTGANTDMAIAAGVAVTGAAVFSTTVPNASLAIAANVGIIGSAVFSTFPPAGNLGIAGNVLITGSATFSTTVPNANLSVNANVIVVGSAAFSVTAPSGSLAINANVAIVGAIVLASVPPAASLAINANVVVTGAVALNPIPPAAGTSEFRKTRIEAVRSKAQVPGVARNTNLKSKRRD